MQMHVMIVRFTMLVSKCKWVYETSVEDTNRMIGRVTSTLDFW